MWCTSQAKTAWQVFQANSIRAQVPRPADSLPSIKVGSEGVKQMPFSVLQRPEGWAGQSCRQAGIGARLLHRDFLHLDSGNFHKVHTREGASEGQATKAPHNSCQQECTCLLSPIPHSPNGSHPLRSPFHPDCVQRLGMHVYIVPEGDTCFSLLPSLQASASAFKLKSYGRAHNNMKSTRQKQYNFNKSCALGSFHIIALISEAYPLHCRVTTQQDENMTY